MIWFKDSLHIVFEDGLLKVANIITDKLTAKEICLEEVCVNKTQLKELLEKNGIIAPQPILESAPEITPTPESTPEITPEATPTPEVTPEPTPAP